jgi:superfamily II DNA or RNA helicase
MNLREYQQKQLEFLLKDDKPSVVQSPTGTGKSVVMKAYIEEYIKRFDSHKIALITPNQTLNYNMSRYLDDATLAHTGYKPDLSKKILITTFHSARKYLPEFKPDLVIGDELHRVRAKTYEDVFAYGRIRKGFTATPNRHDGKGLSPLFEELYLSPQIKWFIENGYLSDYDLMTIDAPIFENTADSYHDQEKIFATVPEIDKTVDTYQKHARGQTLIFCTTIEHGNRLKATFISRGIIAKFVCSDTEHSDPLEKTLDGFKKGNFPVLINCQMFIEGVDVPQIESLMLCSFTFSTPKYLQIVGRLLRPYKGIKKLLIDLAGNVYYHGTPKNYYEWNLQGYTNDKQPDNKSSVWTYCFSCGEAIARKKHILLPSNVCCLNCGVTQQILPMSKQQSVSFEGEIFTLSKYSSEVLEAIAVASKVSRATYKEYTKLEKCQIISKLGIPDELKIKAMKASGATLNTIDQFL